MGERLRTAHRGEGRGRHDLLGCSQLRHRHPDINGVSERLALIGFPVKSQYHRASASDCQGGSYVEREQDYASWGRALHHRYSPVCSGCLYRSYREGDCPHHAGGDTVAPRCSYRGGRRDRIRRRGPAPDLRRYRHRYGHRVLLPAVQLQEIWCHHRLYGGAGADDSWCADRLRLDESRPRPYLHLRSHHAHGNDYAQRDPHLRACQRLDKERCAREAGSL